MGITIPGERPKQSSLYWSNRFNKIANYYHCSTSYTLALKYYNLAIEKCRIANENDRQHMAMLYNNRAKCFISIGDYRSAEWDCYKSQLFDEQRIKTYWTAAIIFEHDKDYFAAIMELMRLIELNPNSKAAQRKLLQMKAMMPMNMTRCDRIYDMIIDWFIFLLPIVCAILVNIWIIKIITTGKLCFISDETNPSFKRCCIMNEYFTYFINSIVYNN